MADLKGSGFFFLRCVACVTAVVELVENDDILPFYIPQAGLEVPSPWLPAITLHKQYSWKIFALETILWLLPTTNTKMNINFH